MRNVKRALALLLAAALAAVLFGCSPAITKTTEDGKQVYKIIYAGTVPDSNAITVAFNWMAEELLERSDGQLEMHIYSNNTLGDSRSNIESMQTASVQMGECSSAPLAMFTDAYMPLSLPFFFSDYENAYNFVESDLADELADELAEEVGVRPLGWMLNGARGISNNKNRVIDDPSDLNGLKIRVMENDIYLETFETLGAAPTAMSLAEVFTGLQQGTIDGQDNPPGITCSNKFYEVQTNYSTLNHCIDMVPVLVSEEWYQSLPEDLRQIFVEVLEETVAYERELMESYEESDLETIATSCEVTELTDEQRQVFKDACQPVYDWFETQYPELDLQRYLDVAAESAT